MNETTKKMDIIMWFGVYRCDCYKLSRKEKEANFIKAFLNFDDAYNFSKKYPSSAIHLRKVI